MKKALSFLVGILLVASIAFAASVTTTFESSTDPSVFRTNTLSGTSAQGKYVNTTVPRNGYLTIVAESKPATTNMVTGNLVLYATLDGGTTPNVVLSWIARDVSGNITSGNITGF